MSDFFLNEKLMAQNVQQEHHQAELRRLGREARGYRSGWVWRQRCRLCRQLGSFLMSLGRRLLEAGLPQALPRDQPELLQRPL